MRFACIRKRLRAAVSYYGKTIQPLELVKDLAGSFLYHQAGKDSWATHGEIASLQTACSEYGKKTEVHTYQDAAQSFCNEMKPAAYRADATTLAWVRTAAFLKTCFQGT